MRRDVGRGALLVIALMLVAGSLALTRHASLVPVAGAHTLALKPFTGGTSTFTPTQTPTNTLTPTATTTGTPTTTPTATGTATATATATPTGSGTPFGQPGITLSVSTAPPGGAVGVTGTGFAPNFAINFTVGGIPANTASGVTTVSDANGNFSATILVPTSAPQGSAIVSATDGTHAATAALTISGSPVTATPTGSATATPGLSASIGSGPPMTALTLSAPPGSFPAGGTATVVFQDPTAGNPSSTIATGPVNADGSLTLSVTLPPQATAGAATLTVTAGATTLATTFTVQPALSANPTQAQAGSTIQLGGSGFGPNRAITLLIGGQSASATSGVLTSSALGGFSASVTIPGALPAGPTTITAVDGANSAAIPFTVSAGAGTATATALIGAATATPTGGLVPFPTIPFPTMAPSTATPTSAPHVPTPRAAIRTTAYFAEGYTGRAATNGKVSFIEVLDILNANPSPAPVTITYFIEGSGRPLIVTKVIPPNAVRREVVNADVGSDKLVAAELTSPEVVAVTRTIDRAARSGAPLDGSTTLPARAPARNWGFPEGYTGITFQEYLTILNPTSRAAHVSIRLAPQAASAAGARVLHLTVPPLGRITANIRALNSGNTARSVGMLIGSDQPIVPERVEYFGAGAGSAKFGATVSGGLTVPSTALRIPYGSSGGSVESRGPLQPVGDQEYVTVLNPSQHGGPASVTVGFSDAAGHALGHGVTVRVPAGTRRTVTVNPALGTAPAGPLSIGLYASAPIEAEAAQYYGGSPNTGAHPGIALPALTSSTRSDFMSSIGTRLADGTPVNRRVYLYNPYAAPARVAATFYGQSGATVHGLYVVPAGGITSIDVNAVTLPLGSGPIGADLTISSGTGFIACAVGRTADGRSAVEDLGVPPP